MASLVEQDKFLLVKRGLYYRPENCGYTGIKAEAGRYRESDANPISGVTAIHEDEAPMFSPACWEDVKVRHLCDRITALEAMCETLAGALGRQKQAWENAKELGLLPLTHDSNIMGLIDDARQTLTQYRAMLAEREKSND